MIAGIGDAATQHPMPVSNEPPTPQSCSPSLDQTSSMVRATRPTHTLRLSPPCLMSFFLSHRASGNASLSASTRAARLAPLSLSGRRSHLDHSYAYEHHQNTACLLSSATSCHWSSVCSSQGACMRRLQSLSRNYPDPNTERTADAYDLVPARLLPAALSCDASLHSQGETLEILQLTCEILNSSA